MRTRRTRWVAALAGLAVGVSTLAASPTAPVAAAPADSDALVFVGSDGRIALHRNGTTIVRDDVLRQARGAFVGGFSGAPDGSVFLYNPGPYPEVIVDVSGGEDGTGIGTGFLPESVGGTYTPVVGDFDGNGFGDVLWYGPGAVSDSLWLYRYGGARTTVPLSISGTYRPVVLDADGDTRDDVLWYAPGPAADSLWTFGPDAVPTRRAVTIDGRYEPIPGRFGDAPPGNPQDRLIFSDPGGPDPIWTFDTEGGHTSQTLALPAGEPIVADVRGTGRDSILWYRPGAAAESLTVFSVGGGATTAPAPQVHGTYDPVVADLDGDGRQDIAWTTPSTGDATLWIFDDSGLGHTQRRVDTPLTATTVVAVKPA